jgi:hypothetical protein
VASSSTPVATPPARQGRLRAAAGLVHLVLAVLVTAGIVGQVYLIGGYIFGAGEGALDAHTGVGWMVHTAELLVLVAALVARLPRGDVGLSLALAVLGTVQVLLSGAEEWVGALHPLFALLVLGIAGALAQRGMRRRRAVA